LNGQEERCRGLVGRVEEGGKGERIAGLLNF